MAAKSGFLLVIKTGATTAGPFTTLGAIQTANLSLNANGIDVTTQSDADITGVLWRTYIQGVREMSISGDGVSKNIADVQALYTSLASNNSPIAMQIVVPNLGAFVGTFLVTELNLSGGYDGAITFTISLNLTGGAPVFTPET